MAEPSSGFDSLAALVEKLAVLLAAGIAPAAAWGYLAETEVESEALAKSPVSERREKEAPLSARRRMGHLVSERVHEAAVAISEGRSIPSADDQDRARPVRRDGRVGAAGGGTDDIAWRGLAAAWQIATEAGAPLAPTLQRFAASLRDLADNERDARTALAAPVATTRMVMALPLVGVLFGLALGFDTVTTLFTTPPGLACLAVGITLMVVARWWSARLVRGARAASVIPGLGLDLVAVAVSGGASIPRARTAVDAARRFFALPVDDSAAAVDQALALSARAGVPAATLLRSAADEARRTAKSVGQRKAATLSVTLMLPLGLCILPAFMLLGVAPLLISVVTSTVGTF